MTWVWYWALFLCRKYCISWHLAMWKCPNVRFVSIFLVCSFFMLERFPRRLRDAPILWLGDTIPSAGIVWSDDGNSQTQLCMTNVFWDFINDSVWERGGLGHNIKPSQHSTLQSQLNIDFHSQELHLFGASVHLIWGLFSVHPKIDTKTKKPPFFRDTFFWFEIWIKRSPVIKNKEFDREKFREI